MSEPILSIGEYVRAVFLEKSGNKIGRFQAGKSNKLAFETED